MSNRNFPDYIDGYGSVVPYGFKKDVVATIKERVKNKSKKSKVLDLEEVICSSGLKNGMTISFHHHLRNGDKVMAMVLEAVSRQGIGDLTLSASSISKSHDSILPYIMDGTISKIITSGLRGCLADTIQTASPLKAPVVFMTHGGRSRAIASGHMTIDVAFVAASCADALGNCNGKQGSAAFGAMGYPMVDVKYAKACVVVTDNLLNQVEATISSDYVDYVVITDSIGDPALIATGSTRMSQKPIDLLIAQKSADVIVASGYLRENFAFQAGSGAISLAVCRYLKNYMAEKNIVGAFALGGVTSDLVQLLNEGMFRKLYDVQTFGQDATYSLRDNKNHIEISAHDYADPSNKKCLVNQLDVMILSATEIDIDFNINSVTGSNGVMMGALGGAPDTATGAALTVVVVPSMRKRIPILVDKVMTISTPGIFVDILVTERGISVNPRRKDIRRRLDAAGIETTDIKSLRNKIHAITGTPDPVLLSQKIVGVIEYRDGSVLDLVYGLKK